MTVIQEWLPTDRRYDGTSYMWVKEVSENQEVSVGIGQPTIESLGELAYLSLIKPGTKVNRGDSVGSMEAAKMTGELISPVSGVVTARNNAALSNPGVVSADPYGDGWLLTIEPDDISAERSLLHDSSSLYQILPDELRAPSNVQ